MRLLVTLAFAYLGAILLLLGNSVYFEGFAAFAIPAVGISLVLSSPFLAKLIADRLGLSLGASGAPASPTTPTRMQFASTPPAC
jgi:hypothetical protein